MESTQTTPPLDRGKELLQPHHPKPDLMMPTCIIWNTRGANVSEFRKQCKAMIVMHHPTILALLETRMADHSKLMEELGFDSLIQSSVVGNSGGIVLM